MSNEAYTFNGVLIKPKFSKVESRARDVNLETRLGNLTIKLPVITANMKNITGPAMAAAVAEAGGLGLLHRFCTIEENVEMYNKARHIIASNYDYTPHLSPVELMQKWMPVLYPPSTDSTESTALSSAVILESSDEWMAINVGVSIGVKEEDKERFEKLYAVGARIFCIDVAHGHHILVKRMLHWINREIFNWDRHGRGGITLIAGNVATPEGYADLSAWGADVVKVGIGPSPVCRTRFNTGVGVPQLYALQTVHEESMRLKHPTSIIADGGIGHVGDIAKAMKYADAVMIGSMIAGTSETPGQVFRNEEGEFFKTYGGSASGENKGENRFVEGVIKQVKFRGKVKYIFREIEQGLQGSYSYVGARNTNEFHDKCEFIRIDVGAQRESKI